MACPFFSPTQRADDLPFPHPVRLPLGASWRGVCCAPGHEETIPANSDLESCNLGYAKACPRFPKARTADAVRFSVTRESLGTVSVQFAFENAHLPAGHGSLEYDRRLSTWPVTHPEQRIQKLAEAFLDSYLQRNPNPRSTE